MEHTKFSENIKPDFTTPKKILWYENPSILLNDMNVFIPTNDLSQIQKINALARFAIYYSIAIVIFKLDSKWFSVAGVDHIRSPCAAVYGDTDSFGPLRYTVQATSSAAQKRWVCIPGKFSRRHEQWLQYYRRPGSASCSRWLSLAGPNQQRQPLPVVF